MINRLLNDKWPVWACACLGRPSPLSLLTGSALSCRLPPKGVLTVNSPLSLSLFSLSLALSPSFPLTHTQGFQCVCHANQLWATQNRVKFWGNFCPVFHSSSLRRFLFFPNQCWMIQIFRLAQLVRLFVQLVTTFSSDLNWESCFQTWWAF